MTTPTETALLAFVAAIKTKSLVVGSKLVAPERNQDLVSRLVAVGSDLAVYINVFDGEPANGESFLGADIGGIKSYEIEQHAAVELVVAGGTDTARETRFDEARKELWDAIKPVVTGENVSYLGGAVDGIRLIEIVAHEQTSIAGLPSVKGCVFIFALLFTSSDPF